MILIITDSVHTLIVLNLSFLFDLAYWNKCVPILEIVRLRHNDSRCVHKAHKIFYYSHFTHHFVQCRKTWLRFEWRIAINLWTHFLDVQYIWICGSEILIFHVSGHWLGPVVSYTFQLKKKHTDVWLLASWAKVKKANCFSAGAVENSDHGLLCVINIWAFGRSSRLLMRNKDLLWRDLHASDNQNPTEEGKKKPLQ